MTHEELIETLESMANSPYCEDIRPILKKAVSNIKEVRMVTREDCVGCVDDCYNGQLAAECWARTSAVMAKVRLVPVDMMPPWDSVPVVRKPSCYRVKGCVRVRG